MQALGPLLPLVALGLASPLLRGVWFGFLDTPALWAQGVGQLGLRLGLVLCGAASLAAYTALIRGPERAVLDPHPALGPELLRYLLLRTAWEQKGWPLGVAALTLPVLLAAGPLHWLVLCALATGGWAAGLLLGAPVYLATIELAESPRLAWLLNLLRGDSPQLQAALIYAPGVVLLLGGLGVDLAAEGATRALDGQPAHALWLLAPVGVGAAARLLMPARVIGAWHRATAILGEIDAAYAGAEDPEEARRVYLEWALRWMPPGWRLHALQDLRHGWRGLRGWVSGAWALGGLVALLGWTEAPEAAARLVVAAAGALALLGTVALRLAQTDPEWLEQALPRPAGVRQAARGLVVFGWLLGAVVPGVLALAVRQGLGVALGPTLALTTCAAAMATLGSVCSQARARGAVPYAVGAALLWAGAALGSVALGSGGAG